MSIFIFPSVHIRTTDPCRISSLTTSQLTVTQRLIFSRFPLYAEWARAGGALTFGGADLSKKENPAEEFRQGPLGTQGKR